MRWFGWLRRKPSALSAAHETTGMSAGRLRTRGVPYLLPYDVEELNRLDFQHYMLRAALRGNYAAPIDTPSSILDIGTGTGRWARELAATFPNATVIGVDLNPPPLDDVSEQGQGQGHDDELRPANYTFVPGNILEGLSFADGSFAFVHQRALLAAIPHDRWPSVAHELARLTKPGGWVESLEVTELQRGGPATTQLVNWLQAVLARRGVEFADGGKVADHLRQAGLVNIGTRVAHMPCGDAGGRTGKMLAADWFSLFNATNGFMVALGLTTAEEFDRVSAAARVELASSQGQCFMPVYIAYGQREV
jgi:ubiquinone/menaquinone biosynthesis C-methylase UbiE